MNVKKLIEFLKDNRHRKILDELKEGYPYPINSIIKLEEQYPDFPIKDILSLIKHQERFKNKIPEAENLILTDKGGQQASSSVLAKYHAKKFSTFSRVADLCCGNGIDLIHISESKDKVIAVESSSEVLEIAKYNCSIVDRENIVFLNQNAEDFNEKVDAIFADPDRRTADKRIIEPNEISPKLKDLLRLRKITENITVKLSPAMNYEKIDLPYHHTLEFISENGTLKEILLCLGKLATKGVLRKAVLLPQNIELVNSSKKVDVISINNFIFEPDKAIIRAGLVQECGSEIGYELINEKLALLTGIQKSDSKLGKCFKVISVFDYDVKKLKKICKEYEIGELVIKTRGFPLTVEQFRRKINLNLKGKNRKVLFIIRKNNDHEMVLADEIS